MTASGSQQIDERQQANIDRRRAPRWLVQISSLTLCRRGDISVSAELHDISVYGCRIMADAQFRPGEEVHISLADFEPVIATAVWQQGNEIGCRFLYPIDPNIIHSLTNGV